MRLFQTNRENNLKRKRFMVQTKLFRPSSSNQIKAKPRPGPIKKKCTAGPAEVTGKILSLGPARPGLIRIKEKSMSRQGSGPGLAPSSLMFEWLKFERN